MINKSLEAIAKFTIDHYKECNNKWDGSFDKLEGCSFCYDYMLFIKDEDGEFQKSLSGTETDKKKKFIHMDLTDDHRMTNNEVVVNNIINMSARIERDDHVMMFFRSKAKNVDKEAMDRIGKAINLFIARCQIYEKKTINFFVYFENTMEVTIIS